MNKVALVVLAATFMLCLSAMADWDPTDGTKMQDN